MEALEYQEALVAAQENDSLFYALLRDQVGQVADGDLSYASVRSKIVASPLAIERKTELWNRLDTAQDAWRTLGASPYKAIYDQAFDVLRARRPLMMEQNYWDEKTLWTSEFSKNSTDSKWDIEGFVKKRIESIDAVIDEAGKTIYETATVEQGEEAYNKYFQEEGQEPNYFELEALLNEMGLSQRNVVKRRGPQHLRDVPTWMLR